MVELEDHFEQQKLIQNNDFATVMDPEVLASNEQKAGRSYKDKVMGILDGFFDSE